MEFPSVTVFYPKKHDLETTLQHISCSICLAVGTVIHTDLVVDSICIVK